MGKWTHLKGTLRAEKPDETYQDKVEGVKVAYTAQKPGDLAEEYKKIKNEKSEAEDRVDHLNLHLEAVRQLILEWMESQGIDNFKLASGGTLYEIGSPVPKIVDNTVFKKWLKKKYPEMFDGLKMHSSTLTSLVKEIYEDNQEVPPGLEVTYRSSLGLKGAKNGKED